MIAVSLGPSVCWRKILQICAVILISHSSVHPKSTLPVFIVHIEAVTLINILTFFFSITYTYPGSVLTTCCVSKNVLKNLKNKPVIDYYCKSCITEMYVSKEFYFWQSEILSLPLDTQREWEVSQHLEAHTFSHL